MAGGRKVFKSVSQKLKPRKRKPTKRYTTPPSEEVKRVMKEEGVGRRKAEKIVAPKNGGGEGPLFREEGTSVRGKSRIGENPNLLAGGDSEQRRIADTMERGEMVEQGSSKALQDVDTGRAGEVTVGEQSYLNKVLKGSRQNERNIAAAQKAQQKHKEKIKQLKKQVKTILKDTSKTPARRISDSLKVKNKIESTKNLLEQAVNKENSEIKAGPRIKRKGGGTIMPRKMSRVGLSPAEESRSGTMSEAKRKKYARGGKMQQGYNARKDEQLGMTRGKEAGKKMSEAGRRKVAKATRKPKGTYGFSRGGVVGAGAALRGLGKGRRV